MATAVYISYFHEDYEFAKRLHAALVNEGFYVFSVELDVIRGDQWRTKTQAWIRKSDTFIFILSPSSAKSDICAEELEIAERLGKDIAALAISPLGDIAPPQSLSRSYPIKFFSNRYSTDEAFTNGFSALQATLRNWEQRKEWQNMRSTDDYVASHPFPVAPAPPAHVPRDDFDEGSRERPQDEELSQHYVRQFGEQPRKVVCSIFSPSAVRSRATALVQVFLHGRGDETRAAMLAGDVDPQRGRQISKDLDLPLQHGQQVEIEFEPSALKLSPNSTRSQKMTWRGSPTSVNFQVTAPWSLFERQLVPMIRVSVDNIPIGSIQFTVRVGVFSRVTEASFSGRGRRYLRAFLSYSSNDRGEVLKRAQAFSAAGIQFFQDILNLEAGEHWSERLENEIAQADVIFLFWSRSARNSKWVMKEVQHALRLQKRSTTRSPEIVPIILEMPPPPPPRHLRHIHFNDPVSPAIAIYGGNKKV